MAPNTKQASPNTNVRILFMGRCYHRLFRRDRPQERDVDGLAHRQIAGAIRMEPIARAADGFRRVTDEHGPNSFALLSCSKTTNELNYLTQKFARTVIGSNNIDSCNRT